MAAAVGRIGITGARHARAEAQAVVGDGFAARVLEPSPPAVSDGKWFADDPVAAEVSPGRPVVSPVPTDDLTWDAWLADHPEHRDWAADRWLGARRRLGPAPSSLADTRLALHRLAAYVVSPARRRTNGKMALRWTLGGLGTPFFGDNEQVRVVGTALVRQRGGTAEAVPVTTLAETAAFVLGDPPDVAWAEPFDVPPLGDADADLDLDPHAAAFLADWYGFTWSVLEETRADPGSVERSQVQLWPEHFDAAFECLSESDGRRAGFGGSPGDESVTEPYLYVTPWAADRVPENELWNATDFRGAVLPLSRLLDAPDQRAEALAFLRRRRDLLAGTRPA